MQTEVCSGKNGRKSSRASTRITGNLKLMTNRQVSNIRTMCWSTGQKSGCNISDLQCLLVMNTGYVAVHIWGEII